jgi:hypothetical protein
MIVLPSPFGRRAGDEGLARADSILNSLREQFSKTSLGWTPGPHPTLSQRERASVVDASSIITLKGQAKFTRRSATKKIAPMVYGLLQPPAII